MSCVFKNSKTVTKENGYWLVKNVNGKEYKVKDISKCEFAPNTTLVVQTEEEQYEIPIAEYVNEQKTEREKEAAPVRSDIKNVDVQKESENQPQIEKVKPTEQPDPSLRTTSTPPKSVVTETLQMESSDEINQLLKLAGDNAWLVAAALLFSLVKRYLDMKQQNDSNLKTEIETKDKKVRDDLGGECKTRHADVGKTVSDLNNSLTRLERDIKSDRDSFNQEIISMKRDIDEIKKKMYEQELAAKYLRQMSDDEDEESPKRGRPRKNIPQ